MAQRLAADAFDPGHGRPGRRRQRQRNRVERYGFTRGLALVQPCLDRRSSIENRFYLILSADHEVSNNYQAGTGSLSHYENRFTCIRQDIRWRPGRNFNSEPVIYTGLHTAIVVGPAGADIHMDGYGRIKLQLHWDRLGNYDERSSVIPTTWPT